jgi:hypothetical protein
VATPHPSGWDFDALYRGESPAEGIPPVTTVLWDTKGPKESVVTWQEQGLIGGDVLDIGCGLGDNAIYLAQHGHHVTALDISPTALITAEHRAAYAAAAFRAARPGARLLIACFSEANDDPMRGQRAVSETAVRSILNGAGWTIGSMTPTTVHRPDGVDMGFWLVVAGRPSVEAAQ